MSGPLESLQSKQQYFFQQMLSLPELERHGISVLLKRDDFEIFFDAMHGAGLFKAERNPGPVEADKEGFYQIAPWPILTYLVAVARKSGETHDLTLAHKIINVIREVTDALKSTNGLNNNHYTVHSFVEIFSLLPTRSITISDVNLIPLWLGGRFDQISGSAFAEKAMPHFLDSDSRADWAKANRMMWHLTKIRWVAENVGRRKRTRAHSIIDDFWLKEIVARSAPSLGAKLGYKAVEVFAKRAREAYGDKLGSTTSWVSRPAVEPHQQNHTWEGILNCVVDGMRDCLLAWIDRDGKAAIPEIRLLINDRSQIVQRIAIHAAGARFNVLRDLLGDVLDTGLGNTALIHEVFHFLSNVFPELDSRLRRKVFRAIKSVRTTDGDQRNSKRLRRSWLEAIQGKGLPEADAMFAELCADASLGGRFPHPDFHSYITSGWGFGSSPYKPQEIGVLLTQGKLVPSLNSFVPTSGFDGDTVRAVTEVVQRSIESEPEAYIQRLPELRELKLEYQYAIVSGLKHVWESEDASVRSRVDWDQAWPKIIGLFSSLVVREELWTTRPEGESVSPGPSWIPPAIADFIRAGVRDDKRSFDAGLLSHVWPVIEILISRSNPHQTEVTDDPTTAAINSSKGKAIEALFEYSLRVCRVADARNDGSHGADWEKLQSVYDDQLDLCIGANFEFSTLCGMYISHISYLDFSWFRENFTNIFNVEQSLNCACAVGGMAYAPATTNVYNELVANSIITWALESSLVRGYSRESLLQRVGLAYLWAGDELNGPQFQCMFKNWNIDDLAEITRFFWSVRGQGLKEDQVERVIQFWERCLAQPEDMLRQAGRLLANLGALSCYIETLEPREMHLMEITAPHITSDYNAQIFIEQLTRLSQQNPEATCSLLEMVLSTHKPMFDLDGNLSALFRRLAAHPSTNPRVFPMVNRLIGSLHNALELYDELKAIEVNG